MSDIKKTGVYNTNGFKFDLSKYRFARAPHDRPPTIPGRPLPESESAIGGIYMPHHYGGFLLCLS